MTTGIGALNIGEMYREQRLTGSYARILMGYMFKDELNKDIRIKKIVDEILYNNPSHEYRMDYKICKDLGLPVNRMKYELYLKTKNLVFKLNELTIANIICGDIHEEESDCISDDRGYYKQPFFYLYELDKNNNNSLKIQKKIYARRKGLQKFRKNLGVKCSKSSWHF